MWSWKPQKTSSFYLAQTRASITSTSNQTFSAMESATFEYKLALLFGNRTRTIPFITLLKFKAVQLFRRFFVSQQVQKNQDGIKENALAPEQSDDFCVRTSPKNCLTMSTAGTDAGAMRYDCMRSLDLHKYFKSPFIIWNLYPEISISHCMWIPTIFSPNFQFWYHYYSIAQSPSSFQRKAALSSSGVC